MAPFNDIETGPQSGRDITSDPAWHVMSPDDVLQELGLEPDVAHSGITTSEMRTRLEKYGFNVLTPAVNKTILERIWAQLNNGFVSVLIVTTILSVVNASQVTFRETVFRLWFQATLIVCVIIINVCIGIRHDGSASKAAKGLRELLSGDAVVVRDGDDKHILAAEIVPGDVVKIQVGDRVPADLRIIQSVHLSCAEAALTGETVPVNKTAEAIKVDDDPNTRPLGDRNNMAFSSTVVTQGTGIGVVVATGDHTEIGTIHKLVNQVQTEKSNALRQVAQAAKWIAIFVLTIAVVTLLVAKLSVDLRLLDSLVAVVVVVVALIPEALNALIIVVYAWAVSNMAKQNASIQDLPAVEAFGSITVVCSDKRGTLTKNEMTLTVFVTSNARYKFNVNSTGRSLANVVRDDSFLADRAEHHMFESVDKVLRTGPGIGRQRSDSFQFTLSTFFGMSSNPISSGTTASGHPLPADQPEANLESVISGGSPDQKYLRGALAGGILCSKCSLGKDGGRDGEIGNPTELSLLRALYFADIDVAGMKREAPLVAELPFDPEYKLMATVHEPREDNDGSFYKDQLVVHVKGAPDRLIPLCSKQAQGGALGHDEPIDEYYWIEQVAILSSHGLRVLALCRGSVRNDSIPAGESLGREFVAERGKWLTIMGLCAIIDPPRPDCIPAVAEAKGAGIRVVMITGDHKDTALAVGIQLGLVDDDRTAAITGSDVDAMGEEELRVALRKCNVIARASPENKLQIVKALQADGEVCCVTGDSVNDAPVLKAADMGVAMGKEATDIARESADMILVDDSFATIIAAVREGRVVWDNLRKVLLVILSISFAQGMTVLFALIFDFPVTPFHGIQILFCNLVTTAMLGFALAVEPAEEGIMSKPPRKAGKRPVGRYFLCRLTVAIIALFVVSIGAVFWAKRSRYKGRTWRSQAMNTFTFGAVAVTLSARFNYKSSFHVRIFYGNPYCWIAILVVTVLQVALTHIARLNSVVFTMAPMDGKQWGFVVLGFVLVFIVMETEKAVRRLLKERGQDTDDFEYGMFDEVIDTNKQAFLPQGASHLRLTHLHR